MGLSIIQVDAFTDTPFSGNPAAVCVLPQPQPDAWMQYVALEMNLSETAFLLQQDNGYRLRWFTPAKEVDLCGHATLASAHVLWREGYLSPDQDARFFTRSGELTARLSGDWIDLNFPATPILPLDILPDVSTALGVVPKLMGKSQTDYLLVEVESEQHVRHIAPDFAALNALPFHGVIVTSLAAAPPYDFVSRFFAPAYGIDEDPVTGSAHCALAPFWRDRLQKDTFLAYQASSRGGVIKIHYDGGDRVTLSGQAVTVLKGELL